MFCSFNFYVLTTHTHTHTRTLVLDLAEGCQRLRNAHNLMPHVRRAAQELLWCAAAGGLASDLRRLFLLLIDTRRDEDAQLADARQLSSRVKTFRSGAAV